MGEAALSHDTAFCTPYARHCHVHSFDDSRPLLLANPLGLRGQRRLPCTLQIVDWPVMNSPMCSRFLTPRLSRFSRPAAGVPRKPSHATAWLHQRNSICHRGHGHGYRVHDGSRFSFRFPRIPMAAGAGMPLM